MICFVPSQDWGKAAPHIIVIQEDRQLLTGQVHELKPSVCGATEKYVGKLHKEQMTVEHELRILTHSGSVFYK